MLNTLHILNFAIIDVLELDLRPGLTVLTGETGAGKSILVDALQLVAGGRAGAEVVRHGTQRAEVTATFDLKQAPRALTTWLEEQSIEAQEELSIRRAVDTNGRSRAYLNGQSVTVQQLRDVGGMLFDIHGQHEFQSLTRAQGQRDLLDAYGRHATLTDTVAEAYRVWLALLNRILDLENGVRDRDSRLALLRHQNQELTDLQLKEGELVALNEESARLANHGRLTEGAQHALGQLFENDEGSTHANLSRVLQQLRPLAALDPRLSTIAALVDGASIQVREAAHELQHYLDNQDFDAARQDQVERRLATIGELARKHRIQPTHLLERLQEVARDLAQLENADTNLSGLRAELATALKRYHDLAGELSKRRTTAARKLSKAVTTHMQQLGMAGGRFEVEVSASAAPEPQSHGLDQIEFRVSANPGQPLRPVIKVASGGELARLSLAIQVVTARRDPDNDNRCMVFDEVDSGIGGAVAEIVGRELRQLARQTQVLCVTHLPQVASQGHQHLRVVKTTDGRTTRTALAKLEDDVRVEEIARMLGGVDISTKAREHAREMLANVDAAPEATATIAANATPTDSGAA